MYILIQERMYLLTTKNAFTITVKKDRDLALNAANLCLMKKENLKLIFLERTRSMFQFLKMPNLIFLLMTIVGSQFFDTMFQILH